MSTSGRSGDSSRKLINLLLVLSVIVILFVAIVAIMMLQRDANPPAAANNTSAAIDTTNISLEGPLPTMDASGDVVRVSLLRSLKMSLQTDEGARWAAANPDWRLFKADADNVDGRGLAAHWNLVITAQNSILLTYVDKGVACILSVEKNNASDPSGSGHQALLDSNYLVSNVTARHGIIADNSTRFTIRFNDDPAGGTYRLSYVNPVNADMSFTELIDAKNGEAIEEI